MCGIVGFTGEHQAAPIILDGLSKLEYRGYDSAGMAVRDGDGEYQQRAGLRLFTRKRMEEMQCMVPAA